MWTQMVPRNKDWGCHTAEEMAANLTVQPESVCVNIVSAAPCQAEPQQYEVQLGRLRNFLTHSHEVMPLLYPLFVYLHLNLVQNSPKSTVKSFCSRSMKCFCQNGCQKDAIEQLQTTQTIQDMLTWSISKKTATTTLSATSKVTAILPAKSSTLHTHLDVQPVKRLPAVCQQQLLPQ
ncbi:TAF5-like RNA polymerase II p300/CBP-associated factor-associated factor 65 kDa subunit 5L [Plecturocebus cupreus]